MPWGIVAGAAITAVGSSISGGEQEAGAEAGASAQVQAAQIQQQQANTEFNAVMANNAPYMKAGSTALDQLSRGFSPGGQFSQPFTSSDFAGSPQFAGYQFEQSEATKSAGDYAASKGMSLSPATTAAIAQQTQGIASTDYSNWYNQAYNQWLNQQNQEIGGLSGIAGMGQASVNEQAVAGGNALKTTTAAEGAIGNAQSQNAVNQGNIAAATTGSVTGGITSALNNPQVQSLFNQPAQPNYSANFSPSDYPTVQPIQLSSSDLGLSL